MIPPVPSAGALEHLSRTRPRGRHTTVRQTDHSRSMLFPQAPRLHAWTPPDGQAVLELVDGMPSFVADWGLTS